uniref:Ig-like domain-containing protein n=1 Tax=Oreochromis niloticus TaxID=8128 RepID=A0A669E8T9_ORENI
MSCSVNKLGFKISFNYNFSGINGERCNRVNYSKRRICAVKGSSVDISSTYNSYESPIQSTSWFRSGRGSEDLREDSQYAGRVEVIETERGRSTLRIRDLTESDSAEYHFKFKTQRFEWKSSLPGTTLTVTALQVKVSRIISVHESQTEAELKCESSCSPAGRLSFVWFKNNQFMVEQSSYQDLFNPGDVISCAFKGHEDYRSASVYIPEVPSVSVSPSAEIVEGSSVTLTCSSDANPAANYTWYKEEQPISQEKQIIFSSIQSSDSGKYCCTAENELGKTISKVISINVKYSWKKTAVVASVTVLILAVIIICGIIFIRRKGCFKINLSRERPDNKPEENAYYYMFDPAPSGRPKRDGPSAPAQSRAAEEQQDDLCYSSVTFIKKPEEHDYYNVLPIKTKRRKEKDEEVTDVDYTVVRLNSTQRLRDQQAAEYSSALYSTVRKK